MAIDKIVAEYRLELDGLRKDFQVILLSTPYLIAPPNAPNKA